MRICIDLTSIYDKLSGLERFCLNISKNMILSDYENEYFLIFKKEVHKEFEFIKHLNNVNYKIINLNSKLFLAQVILPAILYFNKCDVYLFLAFPSPFLFFNKNIINTVHDMTPWMYSETMSKKGLVYFKILIKNAMKVSRLILTVSNSSKKDISRYFSNNNVEVIYNGVDKKLFKITSDIELKDKIIEKYNLPSSKYIFSLGTVEPRKNLKLLIDAFVELKKEGKLSEYKLVLSGRLGWKYDELLKNVVENNLEKEVIFTGFIDDKDLPNVYAYADFFVFPSLYEGFGIPLLEAMIAGIPVIASDSSSIPEVLGDSGILFKNNNLCSLKDKLIYLVNLSEEEKNTIIINGRQRALEFNWSNQAKKVIELVQNSKYNFI